MKIPEYATPELKASRSRFYRFSVSNAVVTAVLHEDISRLDEAPAA
ncbi:MAG: hypothetical protein P0Y53_15890 [Candidatus Pseudobacter hemicellulosilyticus]|uniref:Uncharacterized protein n=1 Tax=Candidatus Pseudobacter hemicellulosilyticus TaxID=3121375 RepID=A0AAJ5WMR8_9BACT|nr:MAG: hypothetical protein P0Y53_15890 [Pseudobacter sp.]